MGSVQWVVLERLGAATLDVASWNIEWFGAPKNGPTDEALQRARARDVVRGTDADIWGMVEIVDDGAWRGLLAELPGYSGFLANDARVTGGASSYGASEQKVGILFKAGVATVTVEFILDITKRQDAEAALRALTALACRRRTQTALQEKGSLSTAAMIRERWLASERVWIRA